MTNFFSIMRIVATVSVEWKARYKKRWRKRKINQCPPTVRTLFFKHTLQEIYDNHKPLSLNPICITLNNFVIFSIDVIKFENYYIRTWLLHFPWIWWNLFVNPEIWDVAFSFSHCNRKCLRKCSEWNMSFRRRYKVHLRSHQTNEYCSLFIHSVCCPFFSLDEENGFYNLYAV